jgi:hypothetical protein
MALSIAATTSGTTFGVRKSQSTRFAWMFLLLRRKRTTTIVGKARFLMVEKPLLACGETPIGRETVFSKTSTS